MKKRINSLALLLIMAVLSISCKKNETAPSDPYRISTDSIKTTVDSVNAATDTMSNTGTTGTTGATGESSTGSGADGTTQKGNTSVKTDSTATAPKR